MIYFTSDLHLGDRGLIRTGQRAFATVDEMNETIIGNYNAVVTDDDVVYILGDITHRIAIEAADEIISRLQGRKFLLLGNHDKRYDPALFEEIRDFKRMTFHDEHFVLMHYPLLSWPKMGSGSIQLHGHLHSKGEYNQKNRAEGIRRFDVGVDANDYRPVAIETIIDFFSADR